MDELLSLEINLKLTASEDWVTCPGGMTLLSATERGGQTFSVRFDARGLPPGVHFATVSAVDENDPERGSLFSLPITVVVPHSKLVLANDSKYALNEKEEISLKENGLDFSTTFELTQGMPNRRFLTVPR